MPPFSCLSQLAGRLAAVAVLAGCALTSVPMVQHPVAILGGSLSVAGPRGYCFDQASGQQSGDTAVVLMGRCRGALAVQPALLTISVGPPASAGAMAAGGVALSTFFTSSAGRAALARDGRAADVRVIEAVGVGDSYLLRVSDRAVGEYWRALVGLRGRLVTVSANGAQGAPLAPAAGRKLVDATLLALRTANPSRSAGP